MKYSILGHPVSHSLSPLIHSIFAEGLDFDMEYDITDTLPTELKGKIKSLSDMEYCGFNCTMPLKTDIVDLLDVKTEDVEILKSCNTVKIIDGKLYGYTTDGYGIAQSIKIKSKNKNKDVANLKVLLLGAGGTARSAIYSLIENGNNVKSITVLNRSKEGIDSLKEIFSSLPIVSTTSIITYDILSLENLCNYIKTADILINTTNLGMKGFDQHADFSFLKEARKSTIVFDAVYNPIETELLKQSSIHELDVIDGLWMLIYQGVKAFEIWTGKKVPQENIIKAHSTARSKLLYG